MAGSGEITSTDNQIPLPSQNEKDEIEEGMKVDHLIDINGQDSSGSQTKKSVKQIFDEKFKDLNNSSIQSCTIFKVNVWLRESNQGAYTPKMVSIGPYHNKNSQLDPMEKYKLLYLQRFLKRKQGLGVESCISELEKLKEKAIKCYEDIEDNSQFCQMLLLDGCFVVEFIREHCGIYPNEEDIIINGNNHSYIFRDLMLLENQLPFFILNQLHDMTKGDHTLSLAMLVGISFPSFVKLPRRTLESFIETTGCNIKHLLHLKHMLSCYGNPMKKPNDDLSLSVVMSNATYRPKSRDKLDEKLKEKSKNNDDERARPSSILVFHEKLKEKSKNNDDQTWHVFMPNATELSEAGVSFEKVSVTTSIFDSIKFDKGLMTIPHFQVADSTETLLRNLIAYEQQSVDVQPKHFSDFAIFMDNLIESDKDVNLLRHKGIIENWLGEDKEVANLFNKIGNGVITNRKFYYKEECRKAVEHCKKPRNRMMASLIRNYFSSPWVGASTLAAVIFLLLTAIQTILAFTGSIKK